jgi:predicted metalloprotease with PDZ domain
VSNLLAIENIESFDLKYQIYHDATELDKPKLKISCTINVDILSIERSKKSNKSFFYLQLPEQWSEAKNLDQYISHLQAADEFSQINKTKYNSVKKIKINPLARFITLSYEVFPKERVDLLEPIINNQIFHFIGHTALIYPQVEKNKALNIIVESSSSQKENILFANSFGFGGAQNLRISLKNFTHATFAGGAYEQDNLESDNGVILSYGLQNEIKDYTIALLKKIIPVQNIFWDDQRKIKNLIFLHANNSAQTSMSGTHTTRAFSVLLNETVPFLKEDLPVFLAHEHWHTWMGGEYYSAYSYKHMAWLFEGVTDYYAHKTAYQAGILDAKSWVSKYNRILSKHYLSSVKNKTNQDIINYFDNDPRYSALPYTRGKIIAIELDKRIKLLSENRYSLDEVIKNLFSDNKNHAITMKDFEDTLKIFYPDAKKFVNLYIKNGNNLPLSSSFLKDAATLQFVKMKPENYGFDIKSTFINKVVAGLAKETDAYKKGMRSGQKVISYKVNYDDVNKPILLKVLSENNSEKEFLLERTGKAISVAQYLEDGVRS